MPLQPKPCRVEGQVDSLSDEPDFQHQGQVIFASTDKENSGGTLRPQGLLQAEIAGDGGKII